MPSPGTGLRVEVTATAAVERAELVAPVYRFRSEKRWTRRLPPLAAGTSSHDIRWSEFTCLDEPSLALDGVHVTELLLEADAPTGAVSIACFPIGGDGGRDPLADLPAFCSAADPEGWRAAIPSDGFGRFGWHETGNGLLTMRLDGDSVFCTTRDNAFMRWCYGNGGGQTCSWRRNAASSVAIFSERLMRFRDAKENKVVSKAFGVFDDSRLPEKLVGGIMSPGFLIHSHDKVFTIAPECDRGKVYLLVPSSTGTVWRCGAELELGDMSEGWVVAVCEKKPQVPLLLAFDAKPAKAVASGHGYGFVFGGARGWLGMAPAFGYDAWKGEAGGAEVAALARNARWLASLLRNYPVRCDMRFRLEKDGVLFEERPAFLRWKNAWGEEGTHEIPCPPIVSFAADGGYPVSFPDGPPAGGFATRYGPYRTWSADAVPAARYRLARGPADLTLYPRPLGDGDADATAAAMMRHFRLDRPLPEKFDSVSAWFSLASVATAQPLLSPAQQEAFSAYWRPFAHETPAARRWFVRREPFSGREYPISFAWEDKSKRVLGDANSGIGCALSGLDAYARFTGDWDFVRRSWGRILRVPLYFMYGHDWTMMQSGAREHTSSSAIDMDVITYEGMAALVRMARVTGDRDAEAAAEMMLSRYALSFVTKFRAMEWTAPRLPRAEWKAWGVGLNDEFGFETMGPAKGSPNLVNSEVALSLAWIGDFPEVFRLLLGRGGEQLCRDFEYGFVEKTLVDWRKAHPGRRNWHHGNVTPHLLLRMMLGESRAEVERELRAQKNLLPPFHYAAAECAGFYAYLFGGESPVALESFAPARLSSFEWDREAGKVRAVFDSPVPFRPRFTVRGRPEESPDWDRTLPAGRTELVWKF